jgi:HrpA-like RNA helicase
MVSCVIEGEADHRLLLYVPEDDLPPRFLPPGYSIGISTSQHDTESLRLDYAARRLSRAGYPLANARKVMLEQGDEYLAAEVLQASLLEIPLAAPTTLTTDQPEWDIEVEGIAATFGDSFHFDKSMKECKLSIPENEAYSLHLRPPVSDLYPDALPTFFVSSKGKLPAYVKLAVAQQLGLYAVSLKGEAMIFSLLSWLQTHLERILENPGRLQQLSTITTGISGKKRVSDLASPAQKTPQSFQWDCDSAESFAIKKQRDTLLASESHQMKLQNRQKLPAWAARSEILDALKHHSTLIISGETGSGKSTQVVQFVLDALITDGHGDIANIICTQPRRISAIGLADRVAEERSSAVGAQVGYQIRGENKTSRETKISFVTTGVLLRKLATAGDVALERVTHIFVDEVHERSVESDFLLILLKDLLTRRKDLKVVLMSATLNADFFASYLDARQLTIQGRTFPVTDFYVEDMDFLSAGSGPREKSKNGVDYDMIVDLVSYIHRVSGADPSGILIFLPGVMEITRCIQAINKTGPSGLRCLPLHASLPSHEQRKVFRSTPGSRKVVVATNIAETSITIDDIGSVIDTGKVKQMAFDPILNAYKFEEVWCSKAACQQRRGRAGRVKAGFCYKTFSRALETAKMLDSTPPEILRVPLEQVCLSVLAMNKPVSTFLDRAITPPPLTSLEAAMAKLKAIGALDLDASLEKLTPLGRHLSLIAADVHCAKLLVLSTMFSCTEEALTIASALSSKPIFLSTPEAKEAHLAFGSRDGDLIAILNAYNEWTSQETGRSRREWSKTRFISDLAMQEIASTRFQLWSCLREAGLARSRLQDKAGDITVLKSLIGASLSPNVAKIAFPSTKYAQHQSGSIAKDHESREIKFFASNGRVFLHPSSVLFTESEYRQAAFVAFHQQVETSKRFIKQNTPVSIYSQLLFGHSLQLDGQGQGLVVNNWIKLQAFPKIGVLCRLIRIMLDDVLSARFDNPRHETQPAVLDLIRELLISNGVSI